MVTLSLGWPRRSRPFKMDVFYRLFVFWGYNMVQLVIPGFYKCFLQIGRFFASTKAFLSFRKS